MKGASRKGSFFWPAMIPILLGLALRIIFLVQVWDDPFFFQPVLEDEAHWNRALQIQAGDIPESVLPGGSFIYPYAVALLGSLAGRHPEAIFFLQILLDLFVIYLIFRLGRRLAGPMAGLLGSLFYAVHPLPMAYAARVTPVIPAALLLLYAAVRLYPSRDNVTEKGAGIGSHVACGLLLGLGTLLVPLPFLAMGLAAILTLWRGRVPGRLQRTVALVAGAALLTLPVLLHNSSLKGGGFTFAWTDGLSYSQAFRPESWGTPWGAQPPSWETPRELEFAVENDSGRKVSWGDVERWHISQGTQRLLETPLPSLILVLRKAFLSLTRVEIPDPVPMVDSLRQWAPAFRWGLWLFPFLLGLFALELTARLRKRDLPPLLAVPLLALAADHILGPLSSASRTLALPWIASLAGVGISRLVDGVRGAVPIRSLALPAVAGIAVCAVSIADLPGAGKNLLREDESLRLLAHAKEKAEERPEAVRILRGAARVAPRPNPWVYSDLGAYLARETLFEQSIESYRRALQADSTHAGALLGISSVLRASGGSQEAVGYLRRLISLHPDVPLYHNELGTLYMTLGQATLARHSLERAILLDPGYTVALQNLRVLSQQEKQIEELVIPPEMSIAPDDPLHDVSREMVAKLAAGDVAGIDSLAAVAKQMRPDHVMPDIMQGMARIQKREWAEALPFFYRANERVPGRAFVVQRLAGCYLELGRTAEARALLDRALERAPDDTNRRLILDLKNTIESEGESKGESQGESEGKGS